MNKTPIQCVAAIAMLLAIAVSAGAAGTTEQEQDIVAHVATHESHALAMLREAVDINSGTMNVAGVRAVGKLFDIELSRLGFQTQWIDGTAFGRAGHLIAKRPGHGPHVLLIGHLDTVFEPDSPFQKYTALDHSKAQGPGITDMKGGNVIIVQALAALRAVGALDALQLTVVLTGDEERPGAPLASARAALLDAADAADIALGFEDGDGDPRTAVIARRGSSGWQLRVVGKPAHSSQIFREDIGPGAIYAAARILERFRAELAGEPLLTFNPGVIIGGTDIGFDAGTASGKAFGKNNVIAEHAFVSGDIRTITPQQLEDTQARMRAIVQDALPHTSATIEFGEGYPPLAPSAGNRGLLALYDQVSRDLGHGPVTAVDPRKAGAADVSFTSGRVAAALDGLGLMGTGGHTVDEIADLDTLTSQTERAAVLLLRIARDYSPAPRSANGK